MRDRPCGIKQALVSKNERPALDTNSQKIKASPVSSHSWLKLRNHASTTTKCQYKQPNIHKQILQTYLHTFTYRMSYENFIKDQSIFPLVIILLILISYSIIIEGIKDQRVHSEWTFPNRKLTLLTFHIQFLPQQCHKGNWVIQGKWKSNMVKKQDSKTTKSHKYLMIHFLFLFQKQHFDWLDQLQHLSY